MILKLLVPYFSENNTPHPRPQTNKTPQEVRNEQAQSSTSKEAEAPASKNVSFNIQIVEGDSGKAISNMNFFLTYKGNIKKHTADGLALSKGLLQRKDKMLRFL
jgi:hypothetical protein